jgi:AcrR family transcriptional regulator
MKHKSKNTKERIAIAAIELFFRNGYHGTSVRDIMVNVGCSKAVFYAHFKSKGDLLFRIIEEYKVRYVKELIRVGNECPGTALDKFHRTMTFSMRFAAENQDLCMFLNYLSAELKSDVDFGPVLRAVYKLFQEYISQLIRQGILQGIFDKELDPHLAALVFLAVHDGTMQQWVMNRPYVDTRRYLSTYRRMVFSGLFGSGHRQEPGQAKS